MSHDLSIFIDESGDFGPYEPHAPFYIVSLVFHDQSHDISRDIAYLRRHLVEQGFPEDHAVHSMPLIRHEADYWALDAQGRKRLFRSLFSFMRLAPIGYSSFVYRKREFGDDRHELVSRMARDMGGFVRDNLSFFQSFDRVIVYYDNGQQEITLIVNAVFNALLGAEVRKVRPSDYSLFQVADMACAVELLAAKLQDGILSKSELEFFGGVRDLKKNFLRPALRKKLASPLPGRI